MQNNNPRRHSGQRVTPASLDASHPAQPAGSPALPARDAGRSDGGSAGALPSNTAPDNSKPEYFKPLRWGIDSLYLSYSGELFPQSLTRLKALKEMAQSQDVEQQGYAQYPTGNHVFEVKDKGAPLFPYVLEDGAFRIQLSKGGKVPMAYVKVSSAFLAHVGPREAERRLHAILNELGALSSTAQVSRIDVYCDFVWTGPMDWDRASWVTRASGIDSFSEDGVFTGWVIGRGGVMLARLYNKLHQAKKIGAHYLFDLWRQVGRDGEEPVWRLEFQIKREILSQMKIPALDNTMANLDGLWSYATTEWLRLTIPQQDDKTRSRWPIHPLWGYLSSIDLTGNGGPLTRSFDPARAPDDKKLYSMFLAPVISYMAKYGHTELYEAHKTLTAAMILHFMKIAEARGRLFEDFIMDRVALKAKQFSSGANHPNVLAKIDQEQQEASAAAYRKATRG